MALTRDEVFKACDQLKVQDLKVTVRAVRSVLEKGSHSTLLPHLREWEKGRAESQSEVVLPPDIVAFMARLLNREREAARAEIADRAKRAEQDADDGAAECGKLEARIAGEVAAHEATKTELAAAKGVAAQLAADLAQCRRDLQHERESGEEARSRSASVMLLERSLEKGDRELERARAEIQKERDLRAKSECQAAASQAALWEQEKRISELRRRAEIEETRLGGLQDVIRNISQQRRLKR